MSLHFQIEQNAFLKKLSHIRSVVSRRSPVPMLNNTLLVVGDSSLVLVATDMEMSISETVSVTVITKGEITVPALILYDIISKLPSGSVITVKLDDSSKDKKLKISAEKAEFSLQTLEAKDFPSSSFDDDLTTSFSMTANELQTMIQAVSFCMANDEVRQYLNGAYLHSAELDNKNYLRLVATDGHRLAQYDHLVVKNNDEDVDIPNIEGIIIPRKMIEEVYKLLEDEEDSTLLGVAFSDRKFKVSGQSWQIICSLLDGSYPNYKAVIPDKYNHVLKSDRKGLIDSVDRILIVSDQTHSIKFEAKENIMTLNAWMIDGPQGKDELAVMFSDNYSTGFNGKFVKDICSQISESSVNFYIQENPDPVVIKGEGNETTLYVLMPLRM